MTQPTRPYDALYDPTFTVAGPRDHYRQQTLGGGFNIERAPVYNSFFSELPHYPPSTLRLKNADRVPGFIDRNFHDQPRDAADLQHRSDALAVSGGQRPKYFRRPLLAAAEIHVKQSPLPPLPQYQDLNATAPATVGREPRSKTIGTQSDYRENEAQTAPWEPGFVIPEHPTAKQQALSQRYQADGPEVLHLRDMDFADGLPAGLQEVIRIDKMRAKRQFEATLPPLEDAARLPLRQKMIEEWEAREWEEREAEIHDVQDQRLELLDNALQVREEEIDEEHRSRVEDRKKATLAARAGRFADVQATRIKTMRQLIENRKYVEKHRKLHKPTVVERYANFGSGTYAPLQREGRFPESKPLGQEIETEGYEPVTLRGVLELETFLPARLLNPKLTAPKRPTRLDYAARKEASVQRDLKAINDLLDTSKATAGRGHGDCWPAPLSNEASGGGGVGSGSLKRASSSIGGMGKSGGGSPGQGTATGSAATPNTAPLQPGASGASAGGIGQSPPGATSPGPRRTVRTMERPSTPELPAPTVLKQPQQAALVLLQRLLRGRAAQNIMYEGRLRRQELIDELRLKERMNADGTRLDGKPIQRPEHRDAATLKLDALLGTVVSELCALLSEPDPIKREILTASLSTSRAHAAAASMAAAAAQLSAEAVRRLSTTPPGSSASARSTPPITAKNSTATASSTAASKAVAPSQPANDAVGNLQALGITREQAEAAAVRIQAAFHGHKARREVAAMRARGEMLRHIMEAGDEAKVVVCQAAVRGYLDRKKVREMREAKVAAEAEATAPRTEAPAETFDLSSYTDEHIEAVKRIQAAQRGALARKQVAALRQQLQQQEQPQEQDEQPVLPDLSSYTDEQIEAVTRIQAAQRAALARREVATLREQRQQQQSGGRVLLPDLDSYSPEQLEALTRIQAAARGYSTRRDVAALKQERQQPAIRGPAKRAPSMNPEYTAEQQVAVIRIQAAGRGYLARRRVAAMRVEAPPAETEATPAGDRNAPQSPIGRQSGEVSLSVKGLADANMSAQEGLWPKMDNMSGFVLAPGGQLAVQRAGDADVPLVEVEASLAGSGHTSAQAEASLGGAFGSEAPPGQEPSVGLPSHGEPSLAVGGSDGSGVAIGQAGVGAGAGGTDGGDGPGATEDGAEDVGLGKAEGEEGEEGAE